MTGNESSAFIREFLNKLEQNAIKNYEKEHGWIPTSEKLPEKPGRYLVTFRDETVAYLIVYGVCERTIFGYPIGVGWHSLDTAIRYDEKSIIAWMPLPEPYKEAEP